MVLLTLVSIESFSLTCSQRILFFCFFPSSACESFELYCLSTREITELVEFSCVVTKGLDVSDWLAAGVIGVRENFRPIVLFGG